MVITQISVNGFKSLKEVKLTLGHMNLFIGTNASGKSNFLDALRLLQGIGYGFSINEVLNGKPKSYSSEVWEGIRGGNARAAFVGKSEDGDADRDRIMSFSVEIYPDDKLRHSEYEMISRMRLSKDKNVLTPLHAWHLKYSIQISAADCRVRSEKLLAADTEVFYTSEVDNPADSGQIKVRSYKGPQLNEHTLTFDRSRPVLHQLRRDLSCSHGPLIDFCIRALSNMQRLDPSPTILRDYSQAETVQRLGERGENFAALINGIQSDEKARSAYVSWLKQLTPTEVDDFTVLKGAVGEPLFAIKEGGIEYPAPILSDGTLRFAAITAAFFQPDMPDILTIEEIENGIHPSRLRLLVEMLRSQASMNRQVMATTHSPVILAWLEPADYQSTFLCSRDDETGASKIVPLSKVPNLESLVKKESIAELFAEGWLEEAL
jgi:energy-coupling factor transporter ATP-binding protein EcfA2